MKLNKQILEAVHRGVKLALDDFDDELVGQLTGSVKNKNITKDYLALQDITVDLGLPSGTLWAKYNLNVNPDKLNIAKDWIGGYYAWGELENKFKQGKDYNWRTYTLAVNSYNTLKKYCTDWHFGYKGKTDNLTLLQPEDDVAYLTLHCGQYKFNIPSKELFEELKKYTTKEWVEDFDPYNKKIIKGLYGMIFKSTINGNILFLPAAGEADTPRFDDYGEYWTTNLYNTEPHEAWTLHISSDFELGKLCYIHPLKRNVGYSIRPICNL